MKLVFVTRIGSIWNTAALLHFDMMSVLDRRKDSQLCLRNHEVSDGLRFRFSTSPAHTCAYVLTCSWEWAEDDRMGKLVVEGFCHP